MLVAGLKAFCGQPCGWVNDQCKYTMIFREEFREIGDSASLQRPGFHPHLLHSAPRFAVAALQEVGEFPPTLLNFLQKSEDALIPQPICPHPNL